jgi:RNA polymerase sigma-70 factor (ECF subfamily)
MLEVAARMDKVSGNRSSRNLDHERLLDLVAGKQDKGAFGELFDHYGPLLKGFMIRKGASAEFAEDLVQDTMVAVWRKAGLYSSSRGSVSTWIFTIARNLRIDRLRKVSAYQMTDIDDVDLASDDVASDDHLNTQQESALVQDAISELPADQRQVIEMAFMEDFTQMEIAERLNLPLGTIKSRMRLGYQKLYRSLEDLR